MLPRWAVPVRLEKLFIFSNYLCSCGCISIWSRCNIWNFSKKNNVAKSRIMTPNKFAYKAISAVFPRLIYSGTLRRGKALLYQLLLYFFFLAGKLFSITNKTPEYLCVWMRLCKTGWRLEHWVLSEFFF